MTDTRRPLRHFIGALAGPIIWAAHFFVIYGAEALVCRRMSSPLPSIIWIVGVATTLALVALLTKLARDYRCQQDKACDPFLYRLSTALILISAGAVVAQALPALRLPACTAIAGG